MESYCELKQHKIIKPFLRSLFKMEDLITSDYAVTQLPVSGSLYILKRLPVSKQETTVFRMKLLCCDGERLIVALISNSLIEKQQRNWQLNVGWVFVPHKFFMVQCAVGDQSKSVVLTTCIYPTSVLVLFSPCVPINKFNQNVLYHQLTQTLLTCDPLISLEDRCKLVNVTSPSKLCGVEAKENSPDGTAVPKCKSQTTSTTPFSCRTFVINTPLAAINSEVKERSETEINLCDLKRRRASSFLSPLVLSETKGNSKAQINTPGTAKHVVQLRDLSSNVVHGTDTERVLSKVDCQKEASLLSELDNKCATLPSNVLSRSLSEPFSNFRELDGSITSSSSIKYDKEGKVLENHLRRPRRSSELSYDDFALVMPRNKTLNSNSSRSSSSGCSRVSGFLGSFNSPLGVKSDGNTPKPESSRVFKISTERIKREEFSERKRRKAEDVLGKIHENFTDRRKIIGPYSRSKAAGLKSRFLIPKVSLDSIFTGCPFPL